MKMSCVTVTTNFHKAKKVLKPVAVRTPIRARVPRLSYTEGCKLKRCLVEALAILEASGQSNSTVSQLVDEAIDVMGDCSGERTAQALKRYQPRPWSSGHRTNWDAMAIAWEGRNTP